MIQNVLILADDDFLDDNPTFRRVVGAVGEFVSEVSQLYTIIRERTVALILIPKDFPNINTGVMRKTRMRSPMTDIWEIVFSESDIIQEDEYDIYDGAISLDLGPVQFKKKVERILSQKMLLRRFGLVGRSERLKAVAQTIDRIAGTDISVLIVGPSGSGKELVARAVHDNSPRSERQFVAVNCGALAEGVLESELFGHEKGSFTGSVGKRPGLFVQADGGTIFLDEVGETKPDMQVKLLRVLEDGYFYPVGGDKPVRSNVRVIAATNRDLSEAIREGHFREDLYFRLGVVKINLPPLFERKEDILPLLYHFASEKIKGFSDAALDLILRYDWPGNVRQLKNFVAAMAALYPYSEISLSRVEQFISEQAIHQKNLPVVTGHTPEEAGHELIYRALLSLGNEIRMLKEIILANLPAAGKVEDYEHFKDTTDVDSAASIKDMERILIEKTLKETNNNRKATAKKLGIGERTLYRKLKEYNLN